MAWTEKDIPDLGGRTAVVTGANGGLAPAGARRRGALGWPHDQRKAAAAESAIRNAPSGARPRRRRPASPLRSAELRADPLGTSVIDILVNAGPHGDAERRTADGSECSSG
jgi:hypothetical protein